MPRFILCKAIAFAVFLAEHAVRNLNFRFFRKVPQVHLCEPAVKRDTAGCQTSSGAGNISHRQSETVRVRSARRGAGGVWKIITFYPLWTPSASYAYPRNIRCSSRVKLSHLLGKPRGSIRFPFAEVYAAVPQPVRRSMWAGWRPHKQSRKLLFQSKTTPTDIWSECPAEHR
jgi:hypothetical protein